MMFIACCLYLSTVYCSTVYCSPLFAEELELQPLIDEALKNNHEILMLEARESVSKFKIPQAESLSDPMFMVGYQNDGTKDLYTFGKKDASDSEWMFSVSQMFPYPGKRSLKSEMASRDAESIQASLDAARLRVAARVKELYYELFLTYKSIDLVKDMSALFSKVEEAALARYSTGMAPQQEVLMAQTEKYMLLEKEEMLIQKVQSLEAMINSTLGRDGGIKLERPAELSRKEYNYSIEELLKTTYETSPEIKVKDRMIAGAETKVEMAKQEYYPDFTVSANYFAKSKYFEDMWSLTAAVNIPIFYKTKQRQAVLEAEASLSGTKHELDDIKYMLSANIRDNYSMLKSAEKLDGIIQERADTKNISGF